MRVTILGCGGSAGVPQVGGADGSGDWGACDPAEPRNRRTRSSIVIESAQGQRLLVDTGPDLRTQLLACGVPRVDAVLFTHAHADHITGLDDVRILNRIAGKPAAGLRHRATLAELARRFDYAFQPWKPPGFFRPVMEPQPFQFGDRLETPACSAGVRAGPRRDEDGGLRVGAFGYSTDVVDLDDAAFDALAGRRHLGGRLLPAAPHTTHANVDRVMEWSARVGARRTILTHMGPDLDWAWLLKRACRRAWSPAATGWCSIFTDRPQPTTALSFHNMHYAASFAPWAKLCSCDEQPRRYPLTFVPGC